MGAGMAEAGVGSGLTRRRFLRAVGRTSGAGAMLAAMGALDLAVSSDTPWPPFRQLSYADFRLSGRSAAKVVIVGGGVAGLACAYELGKAGYDCTVLEANHWAGGRNLTVRNGFELTELGGLKQRVGFTEGQYMNTGPGRIAQWMVTMDYCRELNIPLEVFSDVNHDAYVFNEKDGMQPGHPLRRRAVVADAYGYLSELLAKATDQGALDKRLTPEDREKLIEFLRQFGNIGRKRPGDPERSYVYDGGSARGYSRWPGATGDPGVRTEPKVAPLSQIITKEVGDIFEFVMDYKHATVMMQPIGGMDAVPRALAKAIGAQKIKLNSPVTGITDGPDRVSVRYRDNGGPERQIDADYCILTGSPQLLARLPHNLGADVQKALNTYQMNEAGKIGLEYRRRWWEIEDRIYGGVTETDMDIRRIWYPSSGYHSERGILVGYYNTGDNAVTYGAMNHAAREARALAQGVKIHGPKYRTELARSFSIAWHRVPYIENGWQNIPEGPDAPVYAPLNRPSGSGRTYFAGDWLSHTVSWQHGAFLSARKTVTAIHQRSLAH